jgi:hypothetical protein
VDGKAIEEADKMNRILCKGIEEEDKGIEEKDKCIEY